MAVKEGGFADLEAVLFENYRAESFNCLNMQGLTHGKSEWLIRSY